MHLQRESLGSRLLPSSLFPLYPSSLPSHLSIVVWMSLVVQNGLVCLCAVALAFMFRLDLGICDDPPFLLFVLLTALAIILGAAANMATVTNCIAVETDWIVVIADKNEDTLAGVLYWPVCYSFSSPTSSAISLQFNTAPLPTSMTLSPPLSLLLSFPLCVLPSFPLPLPLSLSLSPPLPPPPPPLPPSSLRHLQSRCPRIS